MEKYKWNLDFGAIAQLWRGGCIIRSVFLDKIKEAFDKKPELKNILLDGYFKNGWGSTLQPDEVYVSEEVSKHTIEIRKAADSTGDLFAIIALLIS